MRATETSIWFDLVIWGSVFFHELPGIVIVNDEGVVLFGAGGAGDCCFVPDGAVVVDLPDSYDRRLGDDAFDGVGGPAGEFGIRRDFLFPLLEVGSGDAKDADAVADVEGLRVRHLASPCSLLTIRLRNRSLRSRKWLQPRGILRPVHRQKNHVVVVRQKYDRCAGDTGDGRQAQHVAD